MNFEFWEAAELVRCPENSCQSNEQTFDTLTYRGKHRSTQLVLDRKSTRLNSSHLVISYAVFCLKKKKNNYEPPSLRPSRLLAPILSSLSNQLCFLSPASPPIRATTCCRDALCIRSLPVAKPHY